MCLCLSCKGHCIVAMFRIVYYNYQLLTKFYSGPGSSVGIVTGYGLGGPGIESRWGRDFPHLFRPALVPTQPPVQWVLVKSGRGVKLTPHPLLVPWSRKSRAIPLLPPMGHTACTEPQCLYKGALYLFFPYSKHVCILSAFIARTSPLLYVVCIELLVSTKILFVFQGVTFPSMHAILARWIPPLERSTFSSYVYAGKLQS